MTVVHLADSLGCALSWDDRLAGWIARVDTWGMSSIAGAFVAGDGASIAGARAATFLTIGQSELFERADDPAIVDFVLRRARDKIHHGPQ